MNVVKKFLFRRRVLIPAGILLLITLVGGGLFIRQPKFLVRQLSAQNPHVLFYVETREKVLALTIDDAPSRLLTPALLDLLDEHEVPATFFVIGSKVHGNEDLISRIKGAGHELGNHMVQDEASILLSDTEFEQNLIAVEEMIGPLGEKKWCRPGSGWFSPDMVKIARRLGYRCCLGSVYPFDNMVRQPEVIRQAVLAQVYPGAILVLHEGGPDRDYIVPLLAELIPDLKGRGYRFMTVSQMQMLGNEQRGQKKQ